MSQKESPPLGASVLEPGLDLSVGHLQGFGQSRALRRRQVLLSVETFLQLTDLQPRERRPGLLLLWRRPVLVRMTYTTRHSQRWEGHWTQERREDREDRKEEQRKGQKSQEEAKQQDRKWGRQRWQSCRTEVHISGCRDRIYPEMINNTHWCWKPKNLCVCVSHPLWCLFYLTFFSHATVKELRIKWSEVKFDHFTFIIIIAETYSQVFLYFFLSVQTQAGLHIDRKYLFRVLLFKKINWICLNP